MDCWQCETVMVKWVNQGLWIQIENGAFVSNVAIEIALYKNQCYMSDELIKYNVWMQIGFRSALGIVNRSERWYVI